MSHYGDHDGKSKTSSAVDEEHYPEVNAEQSVKWEQKTLRIGDSTLSLSTLGGARETRQCP
jgi:hypothetical protein